MLATRGLGLSSISGLSVSSGTLALLGDVVEPPVKDTLALCARCDHVFEAVPVRDKSSPKEEHPGTLKESRLKDEEAELT